MSTRSIAIVLLALILGFVGVMASVTLFVREPLPIVGANQTLLLHTTEITPQIRSAVAIDGAYRVDLTVENVDPSSIDVTMRPVDGAAIPLDQGTNSAGAWSANGQVTRPGRWEIVLQTSSMREVMQFIIRE
jgi:hypothetical protein